MSAARTDDGRARKVASREQWQEIVAAKRGPCRCCGSAAANGRLYGRIKFLHVIPSVAPYFGDDLADNVIPVCPECHALALAGNAFILSQLIGSLEPGEAAYAIDLVGEDRLVQLYGCPLPMREAWPT